MKHLLLFTALTGLFATSNPLLAQSSSTEISQLIQNGLEKNSNQIKNLSGSLSDTEQFFIYKKHEKSAMLPFVINLFVPFGVGSFIQGDITGGIVTLVGHLSGYALFGGVVLFAEPTPWVHGSTTFSYTGIGRGVMFFSYAVFGAASLFSYIRPFVFSGNYNKKLKQVLGMTYAHGINVRPVIMADSVNTFYGVELGLRY